MSSLKPFFGVSPHPPSARLWLSSMDTGARLCLRTSFKHRYVDDLAFLCVSKSNILSVTTSVHTHSVFFLAKRTQNSKKGKIFVRIKFYILVHVILLFFCRCQLDRTRRECFCYRLQHLVTELEDIRTIIDACTCTFE